jgi:hypothetical protein
VGGRVKTVDDEIPLLSWSLHLLGEAEWAGAVGAAFGFSLRASLRLILVLKPVRSWNRVGSVCARVRFFSWGGGRRARRRQKASRLAFFFLEVLGFSAYLGCLPA